MSTHLAPRHAAIPTGDARLLDALAEFGHTHRRHTPKHRKPVHAASWQSFDAERAEYAAEVYGMVREHTGRHVAVTA